MLIPGLKNITMISAGSDYVLALDAEGTIYGWGDGEQNQLGHRVGPRRRYESLLPTLAGLPKKKFAAVYAASNHAFAIDKNGDTWAWGLNNFGQTGIKDSAGEGGATILPPRKVPSLKGKNMKMLDGGSHHSIGVTQDGECLVWGRMDASQMGIDPSTLPLDDPEKVTLVDGKPRILLEPTALPIPKCVYAASGSDHNLVVTAEGKAYSWGFNPLNQCGQGTDEDVVVATLLDNTASKKEKFTWAGAGGQYSMLAGPVQNETVEGGSA
jgi:regulator of chromosome condensation